MQKPMLDLFDAPLLPGLSSSLDLVTEAEERSLINAIDAAELTPFRFQGWTGKRLTRSFGWHYDFENGQVARADPIPDWLLPIRARMAGLAGLAPELLIQALLIRYDPGAGIGWHRDRPIYEHVLGLSLGTPAEMRFRRRRGERDFERASLPLDPRAVYHIGGEARYVWEHSIAATDRTRWSITFRSASEKGRAIFV
jgi:alkylated DNA repair protein (DNA oxidative demethylase)